MWRCVKGDKGGKGGEVQLIPTPVGRPAAVAAKSSQHTREESVNLMDSETMMGKHVSRVAVVVGLGVSVAVLVEFAVLVLNKSKETARREKSLICMVLRGKDKYLSLQGSIEVL